MTPSTEAGKRLLGRLDKVLAGIGQLIVTIDRRRGEEAILLLMEGRTDASDDIVAAEAEAVAAERVRIAAAVRELPTSEASWGSVPVVTLAAVLAIVKKP